MKRSPPSPPEPTPTSPALSPYAPPAAVPVISISSTASSTVTAAASPVLALAAHIPSNEIGTGYFQETHPQNLFKECSDYCEMVGIPEQMPRLLEIAMRTAITRSGVAVLVIPGEIFLHDAATDSPVQPIHIPNPILRPNDEELRKAASLLNAGKESHHPRRRRM